MSALAVGTMFFCLVSSVHDGDTWRCKDGITVRMRGADAFELSEPNGRAAGDFMRQLIKGKRLTCWVTQEEESHDRTVASCSLPAVGDLAVLLVTNGYARACKGFGGDALNAVEPVALTGPAWCEGAPR